MIRDRWCMDVVLFCYPFFSLTLIFTAVFSPLHRQPSYDKNFQRVFVKCTMKNSLTSEKSDWEKNWNMCIVYITEYRNCVVCVLYLIYFTIKLTAYLDYMSHSTRYKFRVNISFAEDIFFLFLAPIIIPDSWHFKFCYEWKDIFSQQIFGWMPLDISFFNLLTYSFFTLFFSLRTNLVGILKFWRVLRKTSGPTLNC